MRNRLMVWIVAGALLPVLPAQAGWDQGVAAFKAGNFAEAARQFEEMVATNPDQAAAQMMLGRSLLKSNRAAQAVTALRKAYDLYSFKMLPRLGRLVAGDADSYRYLAESIRMHPDQEELKAMMEQAGLARVDYFNLSAGVVALHRGYKI